ncbi:MAG: amidohydrolase family protein [Clostridiales bacterium]|nr:amidohydrolase family protein [Clostridiales bacterium]
MLNVTNGRIVLENKIFIGNLYLKDGLIYTISKDKVYEGDIIDAKGQLVTPGFIDIHCHGGGGQLFAFDPITALRGHKKRGTLGVLPTIGYNMSKEGFINGVKNIVKIKDEAILGINCEGPFVNPEYGADTRNARKVDKKEYEAIYEAGQGKIRIWMISPDIDNAREFIDYLKTKNEVVSCAGHTGCTKEQLKDIQLICHLYDGMGPKQRACKDIHETGTAEAVLADDQLYAELIADSKGVHVSDLLLKITFRAMGEDKIILISDAIGTKENYSDGDLNYNELGQLAGSMMSVNLAVCNMVKHTGITWPQGVKLATLNPAKLLGLDKNLGSILKGKKANIVVMSEKGDVYHVIENGEIYNG